MPTSATVISSVTGLLVVTIAALLAGCGSGQPHRFAYGVTYWPPESEAANANEDYVRDSIGRVLEASEVFSIQVPWSLHNPELLEKTRPLANVAREHGKYLSVSIDWMELNRTAVLDFDRIQWTFEDESTRREFSGRVLQLCTQLRPDVLSLGVEVNYYAIRDPDGFRGFVRLFRELRSSIRKDCPATVVALSFQYELLQGYQGFGDKGVTSQPQWELISHFGPELDVIGMSLYPSLWFEDPNQIPGDYLAPLDSMDRPVAVMETAWPTLDDAGGIEQDQYLRWLVEAIETKDVCLLIWTSAKDTLRGEMEPREVANSEVLPHWMGTLGLWKFYGTPKRAAERWMRLLRDHHIGGKGHIGPCASRS